MNYAQVTAAAIAYADRQDIEVAKNIDVFILMVESRINRLLDTREQSCRAIVDTVDDQRYYSLPPDYVGMRDIQINQPDDQGENKSYPVDYLSPVLMNSRTNSPWEGRYYYTIIANQIELSTAIDAGSKIEIVYYQRVPNLNSADNENWLSKSHPDAYIAGLTAEIEIFAKNYEAGELWYGRVTSIINELETVDIDERWSGTPLQVRLG